MTKDEVLEYIDLFQNEFNSFDKIQEFINKQDEVIQELKSDFEMISGELETSIAKYNILEQDTLKLQNDLLIANNELIQLRNENF